MLVCCHFMYVFKPTSDAKAGLHFVTVAVLFPDPIICMTLESSTKNMGFIFLCFSDGAGAGMYHLL